MSVTYEVIPISGIDEQGTPPCECLIAWSPCRRPSVVRVFGKCTKCTNYGHVFACTLCCRDLITGVGGCGRCKRTGCITARES